MLNGERVSEKERERERESVFLRVSLRVRVFVSMCESARMGVRKPRHRKGGEKKEINRKN